MSSWEKPLPFIETVDGRLVINKITAEKLDLIEKPMVIVCIAGLSRTGKSYLMNRLARKTSGFSTGSSLDSHTKGFWVWCVDHPLHTANSLLLIDTIGLGDPFGNGKTYDTWICCLAILLSSVFVYNIMSRLESHVTDELLYVTEMTQHIQLKINSKFNVQCEELFSLFLLIIRDFYLIPVINGKKITSDEYMERMLFKEDNNEVKEKFNRNRKGRLHFKNRKCFFFPRPTQEDNALRHLDKIPEKSLRKEFIELVEEFCGFIYELGPVKKINDSDDIVGKNFTKLTQFYIEVLNGGIIPCLETRILAISDKENHQILEECCQTYMQKMTELVTFPLSSDQLMLIHDQCSQDVEEIYFKNIFIDKQCKYYRQLQDYLKKSCKIFQEKNKSSSKDKYNQLLQNLFSSVNKKISSGIYISPGGYKVYKEDISSIKKQYQMIPNKGLKADVCLKQFLNQHQFEKEIIFIADERLTQKRKDLEVFKSIININKKGIQMQTHLLNIFHEHEENLMKAHKEHLKSLRDQYNELKQQNTIKKLKLLHYQLATQNKYLCDEFEKQTTELKKKIIKFEHLHQNLKFKMLAKIINITSVTLSLVPYPICKALGIGLSILSQIMQYFRFY